MSPRARSESECEDINRLFLLHSHRQRLCGASRLASPFGRRPSRRRFDRSPRDGELKGNVNIEVHLPGVRGRPEKIPASPMVQRRRNARRGKTAPRRKSPNSPPKNLKTRLRLSPRRPPDRTEPQRGNRNRCAGKTPRRPRSSAASQVRPISLERLDRMMNAVGELVINRTRMVGRLAELVKLVEVLNFSKSRLSGKVSEFQEKHEFSKIQPLLVPGSQPPRWTPLWEFPGRLRSLLTIFSNSATWRWTATMTSTSFPALLPKFPRTSTLSSPSWKVSWAELIQISMSSPSSRTTCRTKSPPRAWSP